MKKYPWLLVVLLYSSSLFASSANRSELDLYVQSDATGMLDRTSIYFDLGTSANYVFPEDMQKVFDTTSATPQFYSVSADNMKCYSNGYGLFNATTIVPIGVRTVDSGSYFFSASSIQNFDAAAIILLEDRQQHVYTNLRTSGYRIRINQSGFTDGRFFIHFVTPPTVSSTGAGCTGNNGSLAVSMDGAITWTTVSIYDSVSQTLVQTMHNVNSYFSLGMLQPSTYIVVFNYNSYTAGKSVAITGQQINASITSSATHVAVNELIHFSATAQNATQFEWDFGDSSTITGITHPEYAYGLSGTYNVSLKCSNSFGCVSYATTTIFVNVATGIADLTTGELNIISHSKEIVINVPDLGSEKYRYEIFNLNGQAMAQGELSSNQTTISLQNAASGVYVVNVKTDGRATSKMVFIGQ